MSEKFDIRLYLQSNFRDEESIIYLFESRDKVLEDSRFEMKISIHVYINNESLPSGYPNIDGLCRYRFPNVVLRSRDRANHLCLNRP